MSDRDTVDWDGIALMAAKLRADEAIKYRHAEKRRFKVECEYTVVVTGEVEIPVELIERHARDLLEENYDLVENGHKTEEELMEEFLEHAVKWRVGCDARHQFCASEAEEDSFCVREFREIKKED